MDYTLLSHYFSLYFVKNIHHTVMSVMKNVKIGLLRSYTIHSIFVSLFFASSYKQSANRNFYDLKQ